MLTMDTKHEKQDTIPIRIKRSLITKIKAYGNMHESYSDVIERLLRTKVEEQTKKDTDFKKKIGDLI